MMDKDVLKQIVEKGPDAMLENLDNLSIPEKIELLKILDKDMEGTIQSIQEKRNVVGMFINVLEFQNKLEDFLVNRKNLRPEDIN